MGESDKTKANRQTMAHSIHIHRNKNVRRLLERDCVQCDDDVGATIVVRNGIAK